ncbi:MAG: hypothetical protein HC860_02820 [Alkalinema sp. RU_4_3]|nr:hypothetical protein [Alkalinema sp. RU_4_3]
MAARDRPDSKLPDPQLESKLLNSQFFRTVYRRDPITGFLVLLGGAAVVLGSIGDQGGLSTIGLLVVGGALGLRSLLLKQKTPPDRDRP